MRSRISSIGPPGLVLIQITKICRLDRRILPDLFREGQGVVAEGKLNASGTFVADTVLAKHDENYMPKEVADALKKKGVWKEGQVKQ